jgi:hypothetical protein
VDQDVDQSWRGGPWAPPCHAVDSGATRSYRACMASATRRYKYRDQPHFCFLSSLCPPSSRWRTFCVFSLFFSSHPLFPIYQVVMCISGWNLVFAEVWVPHVC